jgi:hypothetical protein
MNYEPPKDIWERKKLGLELRQKYELYFVSVAFTLAGLSVQTATNSGPPWRIFIELTSWGLFLVAGLLGMWRISKLWQLEVGIADYQLTELGSGPNKKYLAGLDQFGARIRGAGTFQSGAFLIGLVLVAISRAVILICP